MSSAAAVSRDMMIKCQLMPNRVVEPKLLGIVGSIPREMFVPDIVKGVAYMDDDVEIGYGRWLPEPVAFCQMLQLAGITETDKVLDVGGATGYGAAVISGLAGQVVLLEEENKLLESARENLRNLGVSNVSFVNGLHAEGCQKHAPYDVVFIGGFAEDMPESLKNQLSMGGRLVASTVFDGVMRAAVFTKTEHSVVCRQGFEANIKPIPGFRKEKKFDF